MSSPIGDIIQNPNIEGSLANDKKKAEERSLLAKVLQGGKDIAIDAGNKAGRFANEINKGAAFLPDAIINKINTTDPRFRVKDPIEKLLRAIGGIQDLPPAETTGDKLVESSGNAVGGLIVPGGIAANGAGAVGKFLGRTLLGTKAPLTSAKQLANPTFASTIGGASTQAALQPTIQDSFPDSPTAQTALNFGAGLLGGAAGGLGAWRALRGSSNALPKATAAQMGDINSPNTRDLIARQLDLAKKDPKSADILSQISQNQEASILSKLDAKNPIKGSQIVEEITNSIQRLKAERAQDYEAAFNALVQDAPQQGINIDRTLKFIGNLHNKTARGSPLQNALRKASELITENADNPERLISAKTAIQDLTEHTSGLNLGSKQSAVLQKITKQLNEDIGDALPGYRELNKTYSNQTKNIETLLEGAVGKTASLESKKPSAIIQQMFEKTDPELIGQLKQVLPEGVYNQAADMYLSDVAKRALGSRTKNQINKINQYDGIAKILEKNREALRATLPEAQNGLVDQVIADVNQTGIGRPRNDYAIDARRGIAVGDEVKGLGKITSAIGNVAGKLGSNYLSRNEMLTGQSPSSQIMQGLGNVGARATQKGFTANSLAQESPQAPDQIQGQIPTQNPMQEAPLPNQADIEATPQASGSFDDILEKHKGNQGAAQPPSNEAQGGGSFDDILEKYKGAASAPDQNLMRKIKGRESSNNYQAMNDQGYSGAYQMGAQALEDVGLLKQGASKVGNQSLDNPQNWTIEGGKNEFLSDPQLQDMAMQEFTRLNEQRLLAKGLINKNTSPNQRNGYLSASHLGGVGGAADLAKGLARKDSNGTSTRNYYNMGLGA